MSDGVITPESKSDFMRKLEMCEQTGDISEPTIESFWTWMYGGGDEIVQVSAFPVPTEDQTQDDLGQGKWIQARSLGEFKQFCDTHSGLWRYHVYAGVNTLDHSPDRGRGRLEHIDNIDHISFDIETKTESYGGATKQEVWWSYQYALAQVKFMSEEYGVYPMVVMSENGIHLHFKCDFPVNDDLLVGKQHLYVKYITHQAMESKYAKVIESEAPDHIVFDQDDVSDPPRVMKVPGTRGIKSDNGRLCAIIHRPELRKVGKITEDDISVDTDEFETDDTEDSTTKQTVKHDDLTPESLSNQTKSKVARLAKNDATFKQYLGGEPGEYKSRSEAEFAFVLKMLNHDFSVQQIVNIMWASGMTKWDEESDHYRERTIDSALDYFDGDVVRDSTEGSYSFSST
jgi:hypothetical protein